MHSFCSLVKHCNYCLIFLYVSQWEFYALAFSRLVKRIHLRWRQRAVSILRLDNIRSPSMEHHGKISLQILILAVRVYRRVIPDASYVQSQQVHSAVLKSIQRYYIALTSIRRYLKVMCTAEREREKLRRSKATMSWLFIFFIVGCVVDVRCGVQITTTWVYFLK